jgi:AcrR family transcriptional regulator
MQVVTYMAPMSATGPRTDERILDAALRVFEEVGFRGATTRRIADEAGVNEVTLFRHFGTKDELLLAALRRGEETAPRAVLPERPVEPWSEITTWARVHLGRLLRWRVLMRTSLCEGEAHPRICESASHGPMRTHSELSHYLERLHAEGLASADWNPRVAASLLMGALFAEAMAGDVMPDRHDHDPDQVATAFAQLFLTGIGAVRPEPSP